MSTEMFERIEIETIPHAFKDTSTLKVVKYENYEARSQDVVKLVEAIIKGFKEVVYH